MKYAVLLALLCLAACNDPQPLGIIVDPHKPLAPDFGNSVRANIDAQVVNPKPTDASVADTDGKRIQNAIHRYETNTVYPPRPESGTPLDTSAPTTPGGNGGAAAGVSTQ